MLAPFLNPQPRVTVSWCNATKLRTCPAGRRSGCSSTQQRHVATRRMSFAAVLSTATVRGATAQGQAGLPVRRARSNGTWTAVAAGPAVRTALAPYQVRNGQTWWHEVSTAAGATSRSATAGACAAAWLCVCLRCLGLQKLTGSTCAALGRCAWCGCAESRRPSEMRHACVRCGTTRAGVASATGMRRGSSDAGVV